MIVKREIKKTLFDKSFKNKQKIIEKGKLKKNGLWNL